MQGAWADSSSWDGVVAACSSGTPSTSSRPPRSLSGDSSALRDYLATITGPIGLVGHSYAAVKALVYVDAFAPAAGESVFSLPGPDSALGRRRPARAR